MAKRWTSTWAAAFHHAEGGAAMIEMAIVLPVVLTLGLGIFEFSNLYYNFHLIANGVRDAGRYAAGIMGDVCGDTTLQGEIKNIAMYGVNTVTNSDPPRISWWTDARTVTVACSAPIDNSDFSYRGGDNIYTVTVTAAVPYNSLGFLGYFDLSAPTLTVSHEERIIGVR